MSKNAPAAREPNRESRKALAEADRIAARGKSRFGGPAEMFDALGLSGPQESSGDADSPEDETDLPAKSPRRAAGRTERRVRR